MISTGLLLLVASVCHSAGHQCPNPFFECPDDATCCLLADGEYGCCPMPSAVCCEDKLHCCPSGETCDVQQGTCSGATGATSRWQRKQKAKKRVSVDDSVCPDERSRCPPATTCCLLQSGDYGCCPAPHAVCCSDHLHCCPDGFRCDSSGERCYEQETNRVVPSMNKFAATPNTHKPAVDFIRPTHLRTDRDKAKHPVECGNDHGCGARSTCCIEFDAEDGPFAEFTCCPLSDAVCCRHSCCPRGYSCAPGDQCVKRARTRDAFIDFLH